MREMRTPKGKVLEMFKDPYNMISTSFSIREASEKGEHSICSRGCRLQRLQTRNP